MHKEIGGQLEIPKVQKAVVQDGSGQLKVMDNVPVPTLLPGTALIKTQAIALQPADYKMPSRFPCENAIAGCDFSGSIVCIHPDTAPNTHLRVGDLVCGVVHGSNPSHEEHERGNGAFTEFVRADIRFLLRISDSVNISPAQASSLGTALATNALALWADPEALSLDSSPERPAPKPYPVLVYGGSSSVGTIAIQLIRMSGLEPVVTCSPRNFDLVHAYGAGATFDYTRPPAVDKGQVIREDTGGRLRHALDCAVDDDSVSCCYAALGRVGGRYASLEVPSEEMRSKCGRRTVKYSFVMGLEALGKEVSLEGEYRRQASSDKSKAVSGYFHMFQRLLDNGELKPHPIEILGRGLSKVLPGLELLRQGKISGKKLVVLL